MKKRITALLLCLVMALSLIPTSAWAANADAEGTDDGISVQANGTGHQISVKIYKVVLDSSKPLGYQTPVLINTITVICQDSTGHSGYNHSVNLKEFYPTNVGASTTDWSGWEFDSYYTKGKEQATFYNWTSSKVNATANVTGSEPYPCSKNFYLVYKDSTPTPPTKPTDNEVKTLLGTIVDVYCTVEQENGADKFYGPYSLEDGTFTVSDVAGDATNGYTCTVTIDNVDNYTTKPAGHTTDGSKNADMVKTITLTRSANATAWSVSNNGRFKLYAKCEQTPPLDPPTKPTGDEVKTLLGNIVDVYCTVEQENGADKFYGPYSLEDGTFTVSDVAGDATNGYTCTVTIDNVDNYTIKPAGHTTDDSKDAEMVKTITLTRSANANEWSISNNGRFKLYAKCDPTPDAPDKDTVVLPLLTGKIKVVDTTKRHSDAEYNVLENSVTVGAVQGNAADGYTCTVTITYAPYVSKYNREQGFTHTLAAGSADNVRLTLNYDKTAKTWNLDNGVTSPYATINVECGVPADPTVADLNGVNVKVSCAKHNAHSYALAGNETLRVVEKKQDANGQWYCLVTLSENSAKTFLVKYDAEKDIDKPHSKVDTYGTVKLVWVDNMQLLSTAAATNGHWVLEPRQGQVLTLTTSCTTSTVPGGNNIGPAKNPYIKDEPKKVESGKTFDAGIALYVGLGILSLTGSAVAIRKREEY